MQSIKKALVIGTLGRIFLFPIFFFVISPILSVTPVPFALFFIALSVLSIYEIRTYLKVHNRPTRAVSIGCSLLYILLYFSSAIMAKVIDTLFETDIAYNTWFTTFFFVGALLFAFSAIGYIANIVYYCKNTRFKYNMKQRMIAWGIFSLLLIFIAMFTGIHAGALAIIALISLVMYLINKDANLEEYLKYAGIIVAVVIFITFCEYLLLRRYGTVFNDNALLVVNSYNIIVRTGMMMMLLASPILMLINQSRELSSSAKSAAAPSIAKKPAAKKVSKTSKKRR